MRNLLKVFVIIVAGFVILAFAKDLVIKSAVESGAKAVTGAEVRIDHLSLSFAKQAVTIKGFRLFNPPGFPQHEVMVDIPEITVDVDVPALLKGRLHLEYLRLDLKEVRVIRNKDGKLNVNSLKFAEEQGRKKGAKAGETADIKMQIDLVSLNIGRVSMKDFTAGDPPRVSVYEIHVKEKKYKNINDPTVFASLVMLEALKPTAIQGVKAYGAAALFGAAFLPVGGAMIMFGNDEVLETFQLPFDQIFSVARDVAKKMGKVVGENQSPGTMPSIKANIQGASVTIEVQGNKTPDVTVRVSARKMLVPRPEIAGGVLEEIRDRLK